MTPFSLSRFFLSAHDTDTATYPTARGVQARAAKVVTDPSTGRTKGFGFVRFGSEGERDRALTEMNGEPFASCFQRATVPLHTLQLASDSLAAQGGTAAAARCVYPSPRPKNRCVLLPSPLHAGYRALCHRFQTVRPPPVPPTGVILSSGAPSAQGGAAGPSASYGCPPQGQGFSGEDAANTTIFVGGLDSTVSEEELRRCFSFFGEYR